MLILGIRPGESVEIEGVGKITLVEPHYSKGHGVGARIGFEIPRHFQIVRDGAKNRAPRPPAPPR